MSKIELKYGIESFLQLVVGTGTVNSVFPVNEHEFVATSSKEIVKFEGPTIKLTGNYQFECAVYVPPAELIVGVTYAKHEFLVLPVSNFSKPELHSVKTNQFSVFHMHYSPSSDSLVTIGTGVKVWRMEYPSPGRLLSEKKAPVRITLVAQFLPEFDSPILNPPVFDAAEELLLVPGQQGVQSYRLNGSASATLTKISASKMTVFTFFRKTRKVLAVDNSDICVWNKFQTLSHRYSISSESIISLFMPDHENAVVVTSQMNFYLINLKTGKFWRCFTFPQQINRIFYISPNVICVSNGPSVQFFKVIIPWKIWTTSVLKPKLILRAPKLNNAARIFTLSDNNFMRIFSPKTRTQLTTAASQVSNPVRDVFYDRGAPKSIGRDELFVILQDGTLCGFNTMMAPCKEDYVLDLHATCMTPVIISNELQYAISTTTGELVLCSYQSLEVLQRIPVSTTQMPCKHVFFNGLFIIVILESEIVLINPASLTPTIRKKVKTDGVIKMNKNIIYIGDGTGLIERYEISELAVRESHTPIRQHNAPITSISFSSQFWASTSLDGELKVWNYNNQNLAKLSFGVSLYSSEVLNGNRDILVGTENEVMRIPGFLIFGNEVDKENPSIDNFDKLVDFLASDSIKRAAEEEMARQAEEERIKKEEEEAKKPKKKVNKKLLAFRSAIDSRNEMDNAMPIPQDDENRTQIENSKVKIEDEKERKRMLDEMLGFSENTIESKPAPIEKTEEKPKEEPEIAPPNVVKKPDETEKNEQVSTSPKKKSPKRKIPHSSEKAKAGEKNEEIILPPKKENLQEEAAISSPIVIESSEGQKDEKSPLQPKIPISPNQKGHASPRSSQHTSTVPNTIDAEPLPQNISPLIQATDELPLNATPAPGKPISQPLKIPENNSIKDPVSIPSPSSSPNPISQIDAPKSVKIRVEAPKSPKPENPSVRNEIVKKETENSHAAPAINAKTNKPEQREQLKTRSKSLPGVIPFEELMMNEQNDSLLEESPLIQNTSIDRFMDPVLQDPALVNAPLSARVSAPHRFVASPISQGSMRAFSPTKTNRFAWDLDKFQGRVASANSDSGVIDPKKYPAKYKSHFFHKDKGYLMSNRSLKTRTLPPMEEPPKVEKPAEQITVKPYRSPTPPILKKRIMYHDLLRHRAKTPETERKTSVSTTEYLEISEMQNLYGRGNHQLQPLIYFSYNLPLEARDEVMNMRLSIQREMVDYNEQRQRKDGKLGDSLIIQPIKLYQEDGQKVSTQSNRVKIIIPRRNKK